MSLLEKIKAWKKEGWFTTLVIFLIIQVIFLSVFTLTWRVYALTKVNESVNHDSNLAGFAATSASTTLRGFASDAVHLAETANRMATRGVGASEIAEALKDHFLVVSHYNDHYTNFRFIGRDGQTRLRVTKGEDGPIIAPPEALANFSEHPFFRNSISLPQGRYLISTLDARPGLDSEERPLIRAAVPVREGSENAPIGLVEIDFDAAFLLDNLHRGLRESEGLSLLLSEDGSIIDPVSKPWPKDVPQFADFPAAFPEIWKELNEGVEGDWKVRRGYVVANIIELAPLVASSGPGLGSGAAELGYPPRWYVVSLLTPPTVPVLIRNYPGPALAIAIGYLLLGLIVSLLLTKAFRYRQEATRKIKELADFHTFVQETMVDGLIVLDEGGKILSINTTTEKIFGFSRQELLGKPITVLAADEIKTACRDMFWDSVKTGTFKLAGQENVAIKGLAKDGHLLDLEVAIDEGTTQGERVIVVCVRDVTQRKAEQAKAREAEERYRILAEYGNDIIFLRDSTGKILYVSPSVKRHLGYEPRTLAGTTASSLLHPEDYKRVWSDWKTKVFAKKQPYLSQARLRHKKGHYLWFESVSEPILDKEGKVTTAVTASRNIMEQLEADDERTRLGRIIESSLNEIYILDAKSLKFEFVNRQGRKNLGYSMSELKKMGPPDITKDYQTKKLKQLLKPLQTGKRQRVTIETKHFRKDGTCYDAEVNLQYSEAVERPFYLGIVEDVTEKKRAEAKAEEAEHRFRMLTEYSNDIIYHRDAKGRIIYVSPSVKKHLGYDPKELIGKTTWDMIHPEDQDQISEWKNSILKNASTYRSRARVRGANGEYVWFDSVTESLKDKNGKITYSVTTARNVTKQIEAEEDRYRLQEIIEDSLNEVYLIDPETFRFRYVNQRALSNLGYTLAEIKGLTPADLAPPNRNWKTLDELFSPLLSGKRDKLVYEGKNRRKDGSYYDVEITLRRFDTRQGVNFVAVLEDITEKKMAAEQLRQAQKMEVVGQMTGGIAHDFNNLLTTILGSLRLLEQEKLNDEMKELVQLAIKSTRRGADLTHRLLAFSRKQQLEPKLVNLCDLVSELETLLMRTVGEAIQLAIKPSPKKLKAHIDPVQFENVILNLAINARDAMPAGGKLEISMKEEKVSSDFAMVHRIRPGRYAVTAISDTGIGMTKDVLRRATEPFFTTKGVGEGSGLGLSMIFGFAKQSGGAMMIDSEPGKGTKVKIYLPLADGSNGKLKQHPQGNKGETRKAAKVLLVEDDGQLLEFTRRALAGQRHKIITASAGEDAIQIIKRAKTFDLLITDIALPGKISGFDVARQFQAKFTPGRVLFCSGSPERALRESEGAGLRADILPKPYELTGFPNKVAQVLDRP